MARKKSDRKSPEVLRTVRAEQRKPVKNRVAARLKARNNENTLTLLEISLSGMKKITMVFFIYLDAQPQEVQAHTESLCEIGEYANMFKVCKAYTILRNETKRNETKRNETKRNQVR